MKAKNLYYAMALCAGTFAFSNVANAQDVFVDDAVTVTEFTCDNTNHYFSNWRNNWWIELSAGGNQPLVERGTLNEDRAYTPVEGKKWTAVYSVGFGRWVSPYWAFRLKGFYGSLHWDAPTLAAPNDGWTHSRHAGIQLEAMWDMFNSLGGVNSKRVFSILPFFGFGGDANWNFHREGGGAPVANNILREKFANNEDWKSVQWTLPVSAGLEFRFRLGKYVDFFAEARAMFYGDNWNNYASGNSIDCLVSAMGGFNFNIGGRGWNSFNECSYVSQVAALNGQVNDLRAQLLACGQEVAALQAQLPCPEPVVKDCVNAPLMATVRFTINSDAILPTEEVNIYNMAEWLKANPNENIKIVGYADKDTGTSEYNMALSERRANAVANALTTQYGINPNRYTVSFDGSDVQPYSTNDWNRIVIFTQK
ncbi:MAG: OmpA family protein [Muribaculaceae bacterium]|nr:OmpA family protein [Muribaculaceae bacterium]